MKYSEIENAEDSLAVRDKLTFPEKLALETIEFFEGRRGFDHWWYDIDSNVQDEIFEELAKLLDRPF